MNIYDIIPEELWIETLSFLNYRDLLRVCLSTESFNNICNRNNISEIIKNTGFPRKSGHCNVIDLSEYNNYFEILFNCRIPKFLHSVEEYTNYDDNTERILNMLYNSGYELVRGDLIGFNEYKCGIDNHEICIFDGLKIIKFEYNYDMDYRYLPKEFTIINNNKFFRLLV